MDAVLKLVDKQVKIWGLKRQLEELMRRGRCIEEGVTYGPCLLVSRQFGSGGGRIGRGAAERLGWQVYDREILDEIAKVPHVRAKLLSAIDERTHAIWGDRWQSELAPEDIDFEGYLRHLRKVVLTLGHHGDAVILGRGAPYLLPSRCSLRVRVVAPLDVRVQRIKDAEKVSLEHALGRVQRCDDDRTDFVRKAFQVDAGCPLNYDLVINTGEVSLEAGVELVLTALEDKLQIQASRTIKRT